MKNKLKHIILTLLPILLLFVVNIAGGYLGKWLFNDAITGTIVGDVLFIIVGGLWYERKVKKLWQIHKLDLRHCLLGMSALLFLYYGSQMGAAFIGALYPERLEVLQDTASSNVIGYLILTILIAPISEELMFRGVFYTQLRRLFGPIAACLISSLLFACMHFTPSQIYLAFACGLLFCSVYEATGCIVYSMIAHSIYNILCAFVGSVVPKSLPEFIISQVVMLLAVGIPFWNSICRKHKNMIDDSV